VGGLPPVEVASPACPTRPLASSASTRAATVERANPVLAASSERVRARPSRSSWNSSPAPATEPMGGAEAPPGSRIRSVKHTFWLSEAHAVGNEEATFDCAPAEVALAFAE
jgi:hypothetical protein